MRAVENAHAIANPAAEQRGMAFSYGIAVRFNTFFTTQNVGVLNPPHE